MNKLRKKKDLKQGDVIYIVEQSSTAWKEPSKDMLKEYVIDGINSSSLYFYKDKEKSRKIRISLNDLKGKELLTRYKAYLNKEDYYKEVEDYHLRDKYFDIITDFTNKSDKLSTEELREVSSYLLNFIK